MNVAIIPARGGSKRIARKNIKNFCGSPMISYAINTAVASQIFDRVVVSTDDSEIASVAIDMGADVPFIRPLELSGDHALTVDVIAHAVDALCLTSCNSHVCCLYPTTPLLNSEDLQRAYVKFKTSGARYVFSACEYPHPIQRALRYTSKGNASPVDFESIKQRTQDLEVFIHDAGQFYFGEAQSFLQKLPILGVDSAPYVLSKYQAVDIDSPEDWNWAERLFSVNNERRYSS